MGKITRLVLWLCKKFTRQDLEDLVAQLQQVLAGREPELQPRDDFRQQHPHYRDFYVDPRAPLTQPPTAPAAALTLDWQQLRAEYLRGQSVSVPGSPSRGTPALPLYSGSVCNSDISFMHALVKRTTATQRRVKHTRKPLSREFVSMGARHSCEWTHASTSCARRSQKSSKRPLSL